MKAVLIDKPTKAEDIFLTDVSIPEVKNGWVLVKIKAFGLNHSEQILREFEIEQDYIKKPVILGIECVGTIEDPSDSGWSKGQKVVALMGGMGRSFDGSYAEYALLPIHHVFPINSNLSWEDMGAVPETYFTAWGSLFLSLNLKSDDLLLVRGGTCSLGYVAIQLAKAIGCKVIATTHREEKLNLLIEAGADEAIIDNGSIKEMIEDVDKALELVGPKTLCDTMSVVKKGGIVCNTGILGKVYTLKNFDPIKDIPNGVYLTGFFSNYPTQEVMQDIFDFIDKHGLNPLVGAVYSFEEIKQALIDLDSHKTNGKIVIKV